jgi:hypothetical protein
MGGWPIWWPMGDSPCISPWDEEANAFLHLTWKGIGWLRWLNGKMANRMANGRFLMTWRGNYISSCDMKRHWLVEKTKFTNFNWFPMTKIILNPTYFFFVICEIIIICTILLKVFQWWQKYGKGPHGSRGLRCGHEQRNKTKKNTYFNI